MCVYARSIPIVIYGLKAREKTNYECPGTTISCRTGHTLPIPGLFFVISCFSYIVFH